MERCLRKKCASQVKNKRQLSVRTLASFSLPNGTRSSSSNCKIKSSTTTNTRNRDSIRNNNSSNRNNI